MINLKIDVNSDWWRQDRKVSSWTIDHTQVSDAAAWSKVSEYISIINSGNISLSESPVIALSNAGNHLQSFDTAMMNFIKQTQSNESTTIHRENNSFIKWITFDYSGSEVKGSKFIHDVLKEWKLRAPKGFDYDVQQRFVNTKSEDPIPLTGIFFAGLCIFLFFLIQYESIHIALWSIVILMTSMALPFLYIVLNRAIFDLGFYVGFIFLFGFLANLIILLLSSWVKYHKLQLTQRWYHVLEDKWQTIFLSIVSTLLALLPWVLDSTTFSFWNHFAISVSLGFVGFIFVIPFFPLMLRKKHKQNKGI